MSQQNREDLIGFTLSAALVSFLILINVLM